MTDITEDEAIQRELQRAQQAHALLSNPLFDAVFKKYSEDLMEAWISSEARDSEGRELLWNRMMVLLEVKKRLTMFIKEGELAAAQGRVNAKPN